LETAAPGGADAPAASERRRRSLVEIRPSHGWASLGIRDLWEYRELINYLVWREIHGIHRQTALGLSWIFLRPLLYVFLLSAVFGRIVRVPSDGVPYPLFVLAGVLPWGFFSNAVVRSARSLVDNMHLISKVYFPRMVVPVAVTASGLLDFLASTAVFLAGLFFYRMPLRLEMLWLPLLLLVVFLFALAWGLWLATLSVKFRDVSFAVNFLLQAMLYLSPVIYPVSMVPGPLQLVYQINPMAGAIQCFRWAFLGAEPPAELSLILGMAIVIVGLLSGALVFRRTERSIVDLL
jgi:lipopolysaccharide transport system permease protein